MPVTIFGNGQVPIQVVQTVLSTTFTASPGSYVAITGLSLSITPKSASNKILITAQIQTWDNNNFPTMFHIYRNGSQATPNGPSTGYTPNTMFAGLNGGSLGGAPCHSVISMEFLDSPATTSAITYQIYGAKTTSSVTSLQINQPFGGSSVITAMEISGS
jgi:hypothetical protein